METENIGKIYLALNKMMDETQVRSITRKFLDEQHLLDFIKIFEKEHNLFRGSHDKIQLPAALSVPQQVIDTISGKTKFEDLEDVSIPAKAAGDFIQYNETTEKWTRQAALAEGSIVIAIADGYFSEDNTNFTWDNTSKIFKVIGNTFLDGAVVINDANADKDFRVEGSGATYTHLLFTDASANMVGINEDAPKALLHARLATCADYAGVMPNTALLLEGSGNISLQLQGATTGTAYICFADDAYNAPAGVIMYAFADNEMTFGAGGDGLLNLSASGLLCYAPLFAVDIAGISVPGIIRIDTNEADAYYELREDANLKWAWGYDYNDSFKFKLGEGIPGTNTVFEIAAGSGALAFVRAADKGLQYLDTGAGLRWMLRVATSTNVVELLNRASHGKVEIHANTATAGDAGDVLVATFEDTVVTLAQNLVIPNAGYIGSVSNADAIQIEADGDIVMTQDLAVTGTLGCGNITITLSAPEGLKLIGFGTTGADSMCHIGFYDSNGSTRRGYIGDAASGDTNIVLNAETGDLKLRASGTVILPTGSTIGNLTLADGSITDSSGAISFGDENLSTTGTFGCGIATLADGSLLASSAAPSTDAMIANKKYVDDSVVGGANHAMLDGSVHTDSVADAVTRGSIIYGNATPKWDELVLGGANTFLGSDGADLSYRTAAQVLASLAATTAAANMADHAIVRGDGGAKGVQESTAIITDAGEMYNPSQPAFLCYNSVSQEDVTGDATVVAIDFDTEIFDQGGDFAANTFTASIDGRYLLAAVVGLEDLDADVYESAWIRIVTSNRTYYGRYSGAFYDDGGNMALQIAIIADMDANDTAYIEVRVRSGTKDVNIYGGGTMYTYFSGALIC